MRAHTSRSAIVFTLALAIGLAGCASGGGSSSRPAGASSTRIVKAELDQLGPMSAQQAIERLRPRWLQSRAGITGGAGPVLYVDGARRSSITDLSGMRLSDIQEMQYMSSSDATNRFGTGHTGGAIMVSTR